MPPHVTFPAPPASPSPPTATPPRPSQPQAPFDSSPHADSNRVPIRIVPTHSNPPLFTLLRLLSPMLCHPPSKFVHPQTKLAPAARAIPVPNSHPIFPNLFIPL